MVREGDWIKADRTTLGADNGIGVAAALAVMESQDIKHGPMEFLFTVDEETGLTGATQLSPDMLEGKILLNMDSEEDGKLYIGCAGGRDTELELEIENDDVLEEYVPVHIIVGGLKGGHSGLNIADGLANAIKLMTRLLWKGSREIDLWVAYIDAGDKHNAIPREAEAFVFVYKDDLARLRSILEELWKAFKNAYNLSDPGVFVKVETENIKPPDKVFTQEFKSRLLNLLYSIPHGVMAMSRSVPGLVETSNNLAAINQRNGSLCVLTSQRSSIASELLDVTNMICAAGEQAAVKIHLDDGYPAWQPNKSSPLLKKGLEVYKKLYKIEPEVTAIHAGLECGLIGDKFPGMDMLSFGPTILGAHSPDERVEINTVAKFWDYLVALLEAVE